MIISLNLPSLEFDIKKLRVKKFLIHRTNTKRCDLELYTWYRVLKFPSLIHGDETGRDKRYWRRGGGEGSNLKGNTRDSRIRLKRLGEETRLDVGEGGGEKEKGRCGD